MERNAFVTGGTGFIGTNLIKLLCHNNWQVTALYRNGSNRRALSNLPVHWVQGSITNVHSLVETISEETEVVFHLAGDTNLWTKNNERQTLVNVEGTKNVIKASVQKKVSVFIHTSSVAAWGNASGMITEQTPQYGGESWINYERTKWAAERRALDGIKQGMKVVILNPANVIGPHDKNNWGRLFTALRDGKLPFIANGCVSIAHVENVVQAHLSAAKKGKSGERYILAGEKHRFSDFIACINAVSGADNMPAVISTPLFRAYAYLSSGVASLMNREPALTPELAHLMTRKHVSYSSEKAKENLDYVIPPMEKSVEDCFGWLKSEHIL